MAWRLAAALGAVSGGEEKDEDWEEEVGEGGGPPPFLEILTEYVLDTIDGLSRRARDALGVVALSSSSSSSAPREEDQFSWSDTRAGKGLLWTYRLLLLLSSAQGGEGGE